MKEKKNSQKHYILNHLRKYGSINPMTALREYGVFRLSARIKDLRDDGFTIKTKRVESRSSLTGNFTSYAQYFLVTEV